jgi:DNA-directed RNA polymerase subunit RPC12/RpoP
MADYLCKCPDCRAPYHPTFDFGLFACPDCTRKRFFKNHDKKKFDEICNKLKKEYQQQKRDKKNDRLYSK